MEIGEPVDAATDVVLRGPIGDAMSYELARLLEPGAWIIGLFDGDRMVFQVGPGDHAHAFLTPAEASRAIEALPACDPYLPDQEPPFYPGLRRERGELPKWAESAFGLLVGAVDGLVGRPDAPVRSVVRKLTGDDPAVWGPKRALLAAATEYRRTGTTGGEGAGGERAEAEGAGGVRAGATRAQVGCSRAEFVPTVPAATYWAPLARRLSERCERFHLECRQSDARAMGLEATLGTLSSIVGAWDPLRAVGTWAGPLAEPTRALLLVDPWGSDGMVRWRTLGLSSGTGAWWTYQHGCEYELWQCSPDEEELFLESIPGSFWRQVRLHEQGVVYDYRVHGPEARGLIDWRAHMARSKRPPR